MIPSWVMVGLTAASSSSFVARWLSFGCHSHTYRHGKAVRVMKITKSVFRMLGLDGGARRFSICFPSAWFPVWFDDGGLGWRNRSKATVRC